MHQNKSLINWFCKLKFEVNSDMSYLDTLNVKESVFYV